MIIAVRREKGIMTADTEEITNKDTKRLQENIMNNFIPIKFFKLVENCRTYFYDSRDIEMIQEDIENLKSPINIKEIESVFKNKHTHTHTHAPSLTWVRQFSRQSIRS